MQLLVTDKVDAVRVRWELAAACAAFAPNSAGEVLDPEEVWRALLAGVLEDRMVEAQWGPWPDRRAAWRGDDERRLAFDAAAVASATPGTWWRTPEGLGS